MAEEGPEQKLPLIPSAAYDGVLNILDIADVLRANSRKFLEKRVCDRNNLYNAQVILIFSSPFLNIMNRVQMGSYFTPFKHFEARVP